MITFYLRAASWAFSKKVHEISLKYKNFHNINNIKYKQTELSTMGQYSIKQNRNVFFP